MYYDLYVGEHEAESIVWSSFPHILIHLAYADTIFI